MLQNAIRQRVSESLSVDRRRYLEVCVAAAEEADQALYLVGGVIRDLLLTGRSLAVDIDLVVEGDALELAEVVAAELQGRLVSHRRFLTAEIILSDTRIDLVTARREEYPAPAELPVVTPSDLADDLARRDFTVNAIALPLRPAESAGLIDPWNGQHDLARHWLRVLHERSFFDDPTRILRGARIGGRLDLEFEPRTAALASAAIDSGAFDPLSGSRLRQELTLLLEEASVVAGLRRLDAVGFLRVLGLEDDGVAPDWSLLEQVAGGHSRSWIQPLAPRWWLVFLMALSWGLKRAKRKTIAQRLELEGSCSDVLLRFPERLERASDVLQSPGVAVHSVCSELELLEREEVALLAVAGSEPVVSWVRGWLAEWRELRLGISGNDLRAAGVAESPQIGRVLRQTLEARQDGLIEAADEMEYALGRLRQERR